MFYDNKKKDENQDSPPNREKWTRAVVLLYTCLASGIAKKWDEIHPVTCQAKDKRNVEVVEDLYVCAWGLFLLNKLL